MSNIGLRFVLETVDIVDIPSCAASQLQYAEPLSASDVTTHVNSETAMSVTSHIKRSVQAIYGNPPHSYTECHLPYGITQCYLPPDTSEHTPPHPQPDRLVLDLPTI